MHRKDLDYDLPPALIAQRPAEPRDSSRLLVLHRGDGRIEHRVFREIGEFLRPGDALVVNDTRVIPARFFCQRSTGGQVEALFLRPDGDGWRVLLKPSGRLRVGERLSVQPRTAGYADAGCHAHATDGRPTRAADGRPARAADGCHAHGLSRGHEHADANSRRRGTRATNSNPDRKGAACGASSPHAIAHDHLFLTARHERGEWTARTERPTEPLAFLERVGEAPLPPYIARPDGPDRLDAAAYQTVYARSPGAVAAPTAGLHFTPELLARLAAAGVRRASVTLHVGLGTFAPVDEDDLAQHRLHSEWYSVSAETLRALDETRAVRRRIVAVGTTSARVLETLARDGGTICGTGNCGTGNCGTGFQPVNCSEPGFQAANCSGTNIHPAASDDDSHRARSGWTDLFIYPPSTFRNVDVLLTNFHLPGSTLLALVMAFAGVETIRRAYEMAIADEYRFYSYGDAMLIV